MAGSKPQPKRGGLRARILFWACVALLWVVTAVLLLEGGTRWWEARAAAANPLIAGRATMETPLPAPLDTVPDTGGCGLLACGAAGIGLAHPVPVSAVPFPPGALPEAGETSKDAMNGFPALDEAGRVAFALLRGELVYVFDGGGRLLREYGDYGLRTALAGGFQGPRGWLYRQTVGRSFWQALREQCRRAQAGDLGPAEVPSILPGGAPLPLLRFKGTNGEAVCLFIRAYGLPSTDLPADTPWEIPFYRYKPHLRQARGSMGKPLDTNRLGYHDTDFEMPKPNGVFRILCLGGSTTEEGATVDATYPGILQKKLSALCPAAKVEVLNCGISGMTSGAQVSKLGEYLSYQPDLVIFYEGLNDVLQTIPAHWEAEPDHWWRAVLRKSAFVRAFAPRLDGPGDDRIRRDMGKMVMDNLDFLARAFRGRGIEVAVCTIPYPHPGRVSPAQRQYFDYDLRTHWGCSWLSYPLYMTMVRDFNRALGEWCAKEAICLLPLDRQFADAPGCFTDVCHMSSPGIGRKADAIMQGLTTGPIPGEASGTPTNRGAERRPRQGET